MKSYIYGEIVEADHLQLVPMMKPQLFHSYMQPRQLVVYKLAQFLEASLTFNKWKYLYGFYMATEVLMF